MIKNSSVSNILPEDRSVLKVSVTAVVLPLALDSDREEREK